MPKKPQPKLDSVNRQNLQKAFIAMMNPRYKEAQPLLIERLKVLVNETNINYSVEMSKLYLYRLDMDESFDKHSYLRRGRDSELFLLYQSLLTLSVDLAYDQVFIWLLEQGADPAVVSNSIRTYDRWRIKRIKENDQSLYRMIMGSFRKSNTNPKKVKLNILKAFMKYAYPKLPRSLNGSRWERTNNRRSSFWFSVRYSLTDKEIFSLIKILPQNLETLSDLEVQGSIRKKLKENKLVNEDSFPLLKNFSSYNQGTFVAKWYKKIKIEDFIRNVKLKEALKQRYGFSSSKLTKLFYTYFLKVRKIGKEKEVYVNYNLVTWADVLAIFYLEQEKPNHSDFLFLFEQAMESNQKIRLNSFRLAEIRQSKDMLSGLITQENLKSFFLNKPDFYVLRDTFNMYQKNQAYFKELLQTSPKFNTVLELHDFFVEALQRKKIKDFKLNQTENYPQLSKLAEWQNSLGVSLKLAETQHELINWGTSLGHCIGSASYGQKALDGKTILFSLVEEGKPAYAFEVSPKGQVLQIQGKSRRVPAKEILENVFSYLKEVKVISPESSIEKWIKNEKPSRI